MDRRREYPQTKQHARKLIAPNGVWSYKKAMVQYGGSMKAIINLRRIFKEELSSQEGKHKSFKNCFRKLNKVTDIKVFVEPFFEAYVKKLKIREGKDKEVIKAMVFIKECLKGNDNEFVHYMTQIIEFGLPFETINAYFNEVKNSDIYDKE